MTYRVVVVVVVCNASLLKWFDSWTSNFRYIAFQFDQDYLLSTCLRYIECQWEREKRFYFQYLIHSGTNTHIYIDAMAVKVVFIQNVHASTSAHWIITIIHTTIQFQFDDISGSSSNESNEMNTLSFKIDNSHWTILKFIEQMICLHAFCQYQVN